MFDEKILMILLPVWLATVAVTLYWGATRPKAAQIAAALLESDCLCPESARTLQELGIKGGEGLLRRGSALRRLVCAVEEKEHSGDLRAAVADKGKSRYYLPAEAREKAQAMYGRKGANLWQTLLWVPLLTAFFFGLWLLGSLVLDTTGWTPLFRI